MSVASSAAARLAAQTDPVAEAKRLRDARQFDAAATALLPYLSQHPDDAGVHWFRAQLLEWAGHRSDARREYQRTLALTAPDGAAADSLRRYIADLSPWWVSAGATATSDDQPMHSTTGAVEAGAYVGSRTAIFGDAFVQHISSTAINAAGASANVTSARLGFRSALQHLSLGGAFGAEQTSGTSASTAIGNAWISYALPHEIAVTAAASRSGYHYTAASIDSTVAVSAGEVGIERQQAAGVAARIAARRERFSDDNTIAIYYAWVLVPVVHGLRVGYAADTRDTDESRWDGAHYNPYYTPENVHVHSVLAEWSYRDFRRTFRVAGDVGLSAHELAPYGIHGASGQFGFAPRSFIPWNAEASASLRMTWRTSLHVEAQHHRTAFYQASSGRLGATVLFP